MSDFGIGALQSPPDERDYQVSAILPAAAVTLPPIYVVPLRPPILNQHDSPMCVAYSTSSMKSYQDRDDQSPAKFWNFDEPTFFKAIGGNANGAYLRNALDRLLKVGYPVVGGSAVSSTSAHRIKAYYSVPKDITAIKTAILALGEIVLATPWYNSWFTPDGNYTLPRPDYSVGGHAIVADGWNDAHGLRLRNSWGGGWGYNGDCFLPYAYLGAIWEAWKAVDV
jgi:hypothetical protein